MSVADEATPGFIQLISSPDFRADPYPGWAALRAHEPVHRTELGAWVLTRHADVAALLRDPRTSNDERNADIYEPQDDRRRDRLDGARTILFSDPPDHTRLRTLVAQAFTARMVERLEGRVVELVDRLLDELGEHSGDEGSVDLVEQFAYPLPVTVICEMMGVPTADHETFGEWSRVLSRSIDPPVLRSEELERQLDATSERFIDYFEELLEDRRAHPGDDLLSAMLAAEDEGDRLTHGELIAQALLLLIAGHETTVNLIGNGLLALHRNPDELFRLRDDPGLDRRAVEELLRFDSPVQISFRIAMEDLAIGGTTFPSGSMILAALGAANRDPEAFAEPDHLDVGREENRHVAFGGGIHFCLGAQLARLEGRIAITRLIRRYPELALTDEPTARETFTLRGLARLPVRLGPPTSSPSRHET